MRGLAVAVALWLLAASPVAAEVPAPWEQLGGGDPGGATPSAVAPLSDGTLLLLRGEAVWRRSPSGAWNAVLRGGRALFLAASPGPRPLIVAALEPTVYVSLDGGDNWRATSLPSDAPDLELSPSFDLDGEALYRGGDRLFRTVDGGSTWVELSPVPGQRVQQVRYSPGYSSDRTILAALVSGPFRAFTLDPPTQGPGDENVTSAGLLVSRDGGDTWAPTGPGPSIDDVPYRHIQTLTLSPSFAADRVLFVYAWGPRPPGTFVSGQARQWQGALFRTADAGVTWEAVRASGPPSFQRGYARVTLSPSFPLDGIVFFALNTAGGSPASSGCQLVRSLDAGQTWTELMPRGSYEGCLSVELSPRFADDRVALFGKFGWTLSRDGGLSWEPLGPPDLSPARPVFTPDFWLYVAAGDGAWRRPPFPDRTDLPTCPLVPAGGFGRLWRANDPLRGDLGCPLEAEARVLVQVQDAAGGTLLRSGGEGNPTYVLEAGGSLRALDPREAPSAGWQDVDVVLQRYAGGVLLWSSGPTPTITALDAAAGRWRTAPDLP